MSDSEAPQYVYKKKLRSPSKYLNTPSIGSSISFSDCVRALESFGYPRVLAEPYALTSSRVLRDSQPIFEGSRLAHGIGDDGGPVSPAAAPLAILFRKLIPFSRCLVNVLPLPAFQLLDVAGGNGGLLGV